MKPLNLDNKPCSPISSNCVIWQGPDIPCIKLCKGDTVSDVVYKLATELCTILEYLDATSYDLSCFNLATCSPNNFEELLQFLIDRICALENITPSTSDSNSSDFVNYPLQAAPCFGGGTVTLISYVNQIANRICEIIDDIDEINNSIASLDVRVTALENAVPPVFTLPNITPNCTLDTGVIDGGISKPMDEVLDALINDNDFGYCALKSATGNPADIVIAVTGACVNAASDSLANSGTPMGTEYFGSWVNVPQTVADAVTNLWVSICDIRTAVTNMNFTVADTDTIDLTFTAGVLTADIVDTGWQDLLGFGFYTGVTPPQCRRIGNVIHFRGAVIVPLDNPAAPGNVVNLTTTSYNSVMSPNPFLGAPDGVVLNPNGSLTFNNGINVIPASVLPGATNLDSGYSLGLRMGTRPVDIDPTYGTALSTVATIGLTPTKQLYIAVLKDNEITNTRGTGVIGNSPLRLITSNVRAGEYLPDYLNASTDIHNAPSNGVFPLQSNTFNLTWPFSCDAGLESQIGGFGFLLDGLIAYI